jgi:hypothetical protein
MFHKNERRFAFEKKAIFFPSYSALRQWSESNLPSFISHLPPEEQFFTKAL